MRRAVLLLPSILALTLLSARADVAPPQPAPLDAVIGFAENFSAGSVEGLGSVLSRDPSFEWRDGCSPPGDRASFLEGSKAAFAEGPGLRQLTTKAARGEAALRYRRVRLRAIS